MYDAPKLSVEAEICRRQWESKASKERLAKWKEVSIAENTHRGKIIQAIKIMPLPRLEKVWEFIESLKGEE